MYLKTLIIGFSVVGISTYKWLHNKSTTYVYDSSKVNYKRTLDLHVERLGIDTDRINVIYSLDDINSFDLFILCLPTNLKEGRLDVSVIEEYLQLISQFKNKTVIIRSTLNLGDTEYFKSIYSNLTLIYIPEFITDSPVDKDIIFSDRVIIGCDEDIDLKSIIKLFIIGSITLTVSSKEAELIKLASNSYLAMRVSFFNEITSIISTNNLNLRTVLNGITLDSRIGSKYSKPSFGFGGKCLEKDTTALANIDRREYKILNAINASNKKHIKRSITNIKRVISKLTKRLKRTPKVAIYGLGYKNRSQSTVNSVMVDIRDSITHMNIELTVIEDEINFNKLYEVDLIITQEDDQRLKELKNKIISYSHIY